MGFVLKLALAMGLAAAPGAADDDLNWESADGSFPDHGGCNYFGPRGGIFSAADDEAAARQRTKDTLGALALMPPRRNGGIVTGRGGPAAPAAAAGACSGIDDCINRAAEAAGLPLADLATDLEFLRRVRLDLTGRIPTPDEVRRFATDTSPDKRERLVDALVKSPEWADRWALFLGDLFRNTRVTAQVNRYPNGRDALHLFLLESLQQNKPYDQLARELIAAEGVSDGRTYPDRYDSFEEYRRIIQDYGNNPVRPSAAGYVIGGRTTGGPIQDTYDTLAFFVARDFLGISLMDCVLCHDGAGHLDDLSLWGAKAKRLEGWELAAFFSDLPRYQAWRVPGNRRPVNPENGRRINPPYYILRDIAKGRTRASRSGDTAGEYLAQTLGGNRPDREHSHRVVVPAYPFAGSATVNTSARLRVQLGSHLTADPQFARAAVNYVWREFFSRGIVEPPDQFDLLRLDPGAPPPAGWDVQPSHPALLEWLAAGFRASNHDLKWLMREIASSDAYQRSSRYDGVFNPLNERYFVRHQVKRLTAEQVHDALVIASQRPIQYDVSRTIRTGFAMQFPDVVNMPRGNRSWGARMLMQAFTPGDREETPRSGEPSTLQALNLMNNPFVLGKTAPAQEGGTINEALEMADDALVEHLYLSVLSRFPEPEETARAVKYLSVGTRHNRARNLMWALFNKSDFYFNY